MPEYVVAADGGNSKTDVVLATVDGAVLAQVQGRGTRPHMDGMGRTARDLAAMVEAARQQAGLAHCALIEALVMAGASDDAQARARAEGVTSRTGSR